MIDREVLLIPILLLFLSSYCVGERHGFPSRTLHMYKNPDPKHDKRHTAIFDAPKEDAYTGDSLDNLDHLGRFRRDTSAPVPSENITTRVTALNDSHQQLMVHWVGEGSSVIICLARDPAQRPTGPFVPSSLYISYDYGDTFVNKTESFTLGNSPKDGYAQIEKFYNHPKINSYCVFVDTRNQILYQTSDNGINIRRSKLTFTPSDLAYDETDADTFVILDKVDTARKLYLTQDGGLTFKQIEEYVKSFTWTWRPNHPFQFFVERAKPFGNAAVLSAPSPTNYSFKQIIDDVEDFQINGDFMFASKKPGKGNMELHISYQRGPFIKAEFQTELDLKEFHVADVVGTRIFIAVSHADSQANLYVSEINKNFTEFNFVLSLESILCYFPNSTWQKSWLKNQGPLYGVHDSSDVAEEAFVDLYKVEGLRGIYIASKVVTKPSGVNIGPEHLVSMISFDHGNTWGFIKPPKEDDDGQPISCVLKDDCTLHLSQKFSQLYPASRTATIMSSKSAPGIIMATGVVGTSLKGHPGVFISRDAGLTWKQILKDYYFFNYGDHGGALAAVKYFKTRGETREILYSTDEGEKWMTHQFNAVDLKIYGLMTEPGENTTVFTMFGSGKGHHQWIIIKVDLFKAFSYNCTLDDYKYWSPSSTEIGSKVPCVLGVTDTYQRRIPHANCYNGQSYDRPVKKEVCQCDRQDFECEFGFVPTSHPSHCIRNKTLIRFDPYAVPAHCKAGEFYNRTKGYRKIDGDQCVDGYDYNYLPDLIPCPMNETTEFLIVAQRDKIARINLSDNKFQLFPITGLKNVIAIEFDIKNNCLYWADIVSDVISRQCLGNGNSLNEIIVHTDLASVEGMSLDWISNVLFFVDGMKAKIEAIRTDLNTEGRMRRTILGPETLVKPRGIAVHPVAGYLFWTDWASSNPSVCRSNLDGSDVKKLFGKPIVEWPNGITVDHIAERIYWVDALEDYIASSDLNGQFFKKIIANDDKVSHPFAVAVFKDTMFWDDWKARSIFSADKDHGILVNNIHDNLSGLMDLKVFSHSLQVGTNACALKDVACDTLCLGMPRGNMSCLCPDGLLMKDGKCICPGGKFPYNNMTCPKESNSCSADHFACTNGVCIPSNWRCDGDNDCGDNSDEVGCSYTTCSPQMMLCDGDKCIPHYFRCDHDKDCVDGTDEMGCHYDSCPAEDFQCNNGKCISKKWKCDGENDCRDGSDELNCTSSRPSTCRPNEFRCPSNGHCIPITWLCDGEVDCPDSADELKGRCKNTTCMEWMFRCPGNGKCLYATWVCDGEDDCKDGLMSDEQNCPKVNATVSAPTATPAIIFPGSGQCHNWMYLCGNSKCVPYWWKCDGVDDCGDNTDELGCGNISIPINGEDSKKSTPNNNGIESPTICKKNNYMCPNGDCIPASWVCDGAADCISGEDEKGCEGRSGSVSVHCKEFKCRQDGACISIKSVCNGKIDCADGTDEIGCPTDKHGKTIFPSANSTANCTQYQFPCDAGRCIALSLRCDKHEDCYDGTDELNCTTSNIEAAVCQVPSLSVRKFSTNTTSIVLYWGRILATGGTRFQFLPTISEVSGPNANVWKNASTWVDYTIYKFEDLEAYTAYNMSVYVRLAPPHTTAYSSKDGYTPNKYIIAKTKEGVPSPPLRVIARQMAGRRVQVEWDPPAAPSGIITSYTILLAPPLPPISLDVPATSTSAFVQEGHFKPGHNYTFWVIAKNSVSESISSKTVTLEFDAMGDIDDLEQLLLTKLNDTAVTLSWRPIRDVDGYIIRQRLTMPYPEPKPIKTVLNNVTFSNMSPGVTYKLEVQAFKGELLGKPVTALVTIPGNFHMPVSNFKGSLHNNTSVHLSWEKPLDAKGDVEYAVRYGLSMGELFREVRLVTKDTSVTIRNLQACDSYMFSVGVVKPVLGPLTEDPIVIDTEYNKKASVKNLQVKRSDRDIHTMVITWDSTCNTVNEMSVYLITVTELTLNLTSTVRLSPTSNSSLTHNFVNMEYGGRYSVAVRRDIPDATRTIALVAGPPIPPPHQLQLWRDANGTVMLYWQNMDLPSTFTPGSQHQYHYEVLVTENKNETMSSDRIIPVTSVPAAISGLEPGGHYSLSVRLVTETGYMSPLSEIRSLNLPLEKSEMDETTHMSIFIGTPLAIISIVACAALVVLALKHRRLSTSFARFANPRYDSRSGAATLGNHSDILDEDDAPRIRGFADDEPLVIA